jgi:hypothetical protein
MPQPTNPNAYPPQAGPYPPQPGPYPHPGQQPAYGQQHYGRGQPQQQPQTIVINQGGGYQQRDSGDRDFATGKSKNYVCELVWQGCE